MTLEPMLASIAMAARRSTQFAKPKQVTVIGDNSQVMMVIGLFVSARVEINLYTNSDYIEESASIHSEVVCTRVKSYRSEPDDLSDGPYFLCVDKVETADAIRDWLPDTLAVFHLGRERRGRTAASGYLGLAEPQSTTRRNLIRRLGILRRLDRLRELGRHSELPLILMYGDPDPDAIGSALALANIWRSVGAQPIMRYTGEIQRYQNKLLINYLKEPIDRLRETERQAADLVATVDCQPGFWKENPPKAHVIIDHHPKLEDTNAVFVDLREHYGAVASMMTEYLVEGNFPINKKLATALLYGLTTDTNNLLRNATSADIKIYDTLHSKVDQHFLARLNGSQVPMGLLDYIGWGINHRVVMRDMMLVHFGEIPTPDILVQSADFMLLTCGINWVVCAGKVEDKLIVVFRGDGHRQDVGKRAKDAFSKLGSAGGHRTMGRAEIPLEGEHVDSSIEILIENLFKRTAQKRRQKCIRALRNYLHGQGPSAPDYINI